jgi:two-component system phosphate regulon sensor histidine kinase PhoR
MPPGPDQGVLVSFSLPLAIAVLLILGLLVAAAGWFLAHRRRPAFVPPTPTDVPWLPALLQRLPCGALMTDAQGRVRLANGQAYHWLGSTGRSVKLPQPLQTLVERVAVSGVGEGLEIHAPSGGDRRLWVEAAALGGNGGVLILIEERDGGGVAAEVYRPLMHTIAHELRTPLTAIMGHAEILGSCSVEEEALWRRSQQFITREVRRLARLVEDLLTLSRLDLNASALTPVNLQAIAEEALSALWETAEKRDITLTLQVAPGLPRVLGDLDRLRQVFVNLLDNGVKYTPPGGRVTVRLASDQADQLRLSADRVQVEVSDTGMGISRADLPHVFDPLFRGEQASRAAIGTGLGLTIVRTILAQHGAEIRVQSEPGRGTIFSFDLPTATRIGI